MSFFQDGRSPSPEASRWLAGVVQGDALMVWVGLGVGLLGAWGP